MNHDSIDFSRNLVKGRIAETLFEQMWRDAGVYTILPFGYERVVPELMHLHGDIQAQETMEIIRRAPDFAVIDNKNHEVHLIEVKYMRSRNGWVLVAANKMHESWKPSYLFIASPDGFFFDKAKTIIDKAGIISPLDPQWISAELQEKYTALLNELIP